MDVNEKIMRKPEEKNLLIGQETAFVIFIRIRVRVRVSLSISELLSLGLFFLFEASFLKTNEQG